MDLTDEELSGVEQAGGEVELAGGAGGGFDAAAEQAASGKWSFAEADKEKTVGFQAVSNGRDISGALPAICRISTRASFVKTAKIEERRMWGIEAS